GKALCEERLNQRSDALETHRRILTNDRRNVDSLRAIARLQMADRRWRECLEAVEDLLRVGPNEAAALEMKGDALSNLGRRPEAYRRRGKPQEALNCLDLVLGVQPGNASALLNRGNILLEQGGAEAALESFERLTQLYPNDEEAWTAQGDVLLRIGREDDAQR